MNDAPSSPDQNLPPGDQPEEPPRWEVVQAPVPVAPAPSRGRIWQALLAVGVAGILVVAVVANVTGAGQTPQSANTLGAGNAPAAADPTPTATPSGGSATQCQAFLNDVAQRLNVTPETLQNAFTGALQNLIDQAVKDGRISQSEANTLKSRLSSAQGTACLGLPRLRELGPGGAGHFGTGMGPEAGALNPSALLDAAASAMKIDQATLVSEMRSLQPGQNLKTLAQQHGVAYATVTSAVETAAKQQLDAAVQKGSITSSQETTILNQIDTQLANGDLPFGAFGFRGGFGGHFAPFGGPGGQWGGRGQGPAPTAAPVPAAGA